MRRITMMIGTILGVAIGGFIATTMLIDTTAQESVPIEFDVMWTVDSAASAGDACEFTRTMDESVDRGFYTENIPRTVVITDARSEIVHVESLKGEVVSEGDADPACQLTVDAAVEPSAGYTITLDEQVVGTAPETGLSGEDFDRPFVILID